MEERPLFRRKKILVDRTFQFQYGLIWLLVGIAVFVVGAGSYFVVSHFKGTEVSETTKKVAMYFAAFTILFCIFMGILSIILTHKVAGAAYRIEKTVRELLEGSPATEIKLRKGDYLQRLAKVLNVLLNQIGKHQNELTEVVAGLEGIVGRFRQSGKFQDNELKDIDNLVSRLKNELTFKTQLPIDDE